MDEIACCSRSSHFILFFWKSMNEKYICSILYINHICLLDFFWLQVAFDTRGDVKTRITKTNPCWFIERDLITRKWRRKFYKLSLIVFRYVVSFCWDVQVLKQWICSSTRWEKLNLTLNWLQLKLLTSNKDINPILGFLHSP